MTDVERKNAAGYRKIEPSNSCDNCLHRNGLMCVRAEKFHLSFLLGSWVCDHHAKPTVS